MSFEPGWRARRWVAITGSIGENRLLPGTVAKAEPVRVDCFVPISLVLQVRNKFCRYRSPLCCMDEFKRKQLADAFAALPAGCKEAVATESQLDAFEEMFGPIPNDFRWFLLNCGGGTVGSEWVDGIDALADTHRKFAAESAIAKGWAMSGVFVTGWDGSGNPFGIETTTGKLLVEDHNVGGIHTMSPSFETFLQRGLLSK